MGRDGSPKFGAQIVALMPNAPARDKLIEALNGSLYGEHVLAKPVEDWPGLTTYLLKEATPQAWYGAKKSFRLSPHQGLHPSGRLGRLVERPEGHAPAHRQEASPTGAPTPSA